MKFCNMNVLMSILLISILILVIKCFISNKTKEGFNLTALAAPAELTDTQAISYLANYDDLRVHFGTDLEQAKNHWKGNGKGEGRTWFPTGIGMQCKLNQVDHPDGKCPQYKKEGGCLKANTNHKGFRRHCPVSCGICMPPNPPPNVPQCRTDQQDHEDGDCPQHKWNGGCHAANAQHEAWRARCPVSCGICVPSKELTDSEAQSYLDNNHDLKNGNSDLGQKGLDLQQAKDHWTNNGHREVMRGAPGRSPPTSVSTAENIKKSIQAIMSTAEEKLKIDLDTGKITCVGDDGETPAKCPWDIK